MSDLESAFRGLARFERINELRASRTYELVAFEAADGVHSPAIRADFPEGGSAFFDEFGACIGLDGLAEVIA